MHLTLPTLLLSLLALPPPSAAAQTRSQSRPKDAILLSEVQSLTLRAGRKTTHRRVSSVPQLKCVSPAAVCALHEVDVLRCTNSGSGYGDEDVQWSCTASLPPTLKLGSTEVICEGYAGPDDPYVLKGSCGVEYRLVLTDEGERRHPGLGGGGGWGEAGERDWSAYLFGIVFFAVVCWIIYGACTAPARNGAAPGQGPRRRPGGGGGPGGGGWWPGNGGGGGGGGGDDPPPPYPGTGSKPGDSAGWRPGFWSGLAGGAAAGYMAGNRGNNNNNNNNGQNDRYGYGRNNGYGGGLFGGNGDGGGYGGTWGSGSSRSGSSGSGSSSSSGARHESTGFGSTSRR